MVADERKRILALVENGTISAEEAIVLLEKLGQGKSQSTELPQILKKNDDKEANEQTYAKEEPIFEHKEEKKTTGFEELFDKVFSSKEASGKVDDVMNELKRDLSEFGARMSSLLNTTFSKVKGFEQDVPFGEKYEFNQNYAFPQSEVKGLDIDIPNGKVEFYKSNEDLISVDVTVKTTLHDSEEKTKIQFLEGFVKLVNGKLTLQTLSKFSQVQLKIGLPEKEYDILFVRSLNGKVEMDGAHAKIIKINLINGPMNIRRAKFDHADLTTKNGAVELRFVNGDDLEVETVNGRIYIEGDLKEVEAESVNGHVVVTTTNESAHKVKATSLAGSVELYIPKNVSIDGKLLTNLGKIDFGLKDVTNTSAEESMLQKVTHFDKVVEDARVLKLYGESRTGTVLVRYNP